MLGHQIIMHQVFMNRSYKFFVVTAFQTYSIVYTGIVYQSVNTATQGNHLVNGAFTIFWFGQFGNYRQSFSTLSLNFFDSNLIVSINSTHNYGNGTFRSQNFTDSKSNSFCTTGNDYYFVL
ncbi:hypothetical protein D3C84_708690 [compost metagenome]